MEEEKQKEALTSVVQLMDRYHHLKKQKVYCCNVIMNTIKIQLFKIPFCKPIRTKLNS